MFRSLRNRLTNISLIVFTFAVISFIMGLINRPKEPLTTYFAIFGVMLLSTSIFIESVGVRRSERFSVEDAQQVIHKVTNLIKELRSLAPILHKDYDGLPNSRARYNADKRYKNLMEEFNQIMRKCGDYELCKKLNNSIEAQKLMAKYNMSFDGIAFLDFTQNTDENINDYVRTKLGRRVGND